MIEESQLSLQKWDLFQKSVKITKLHVVVQEYRENIIFQPFLTHLCAEREDSTEEECYCKQPRRSTKTFH